MMTIRFCECGRPYPCTYKDHEEFDRDEYGKKHFKKKEKKHGGYSSQRQEEGQFQYGQGRE
jgi:hypothetical protein